MSTRVAACRLSLAALAAFISGCSIPQSDGPTWSLSGPARQQTPAPAKKYGDWNGPGAPKPLTYDGGR